MWMRLVESSLSAVAEVLLNFAGMYSVYAFSYQTAAGTHCDDWLFSSCLSGLSLLITVFGLSSDKITLRGFEQTHSLTTQPFSVNSRCFY